MVWTGLKNQVHPPPPVGSDTGASLLAHMASWMQSEGARKKAIVSPRKNPSRRARFWVFVLAVPLLGVFGQGAWAATNHDLLVNHDAFQVGGADLVAATDVVDAPVGGLFVYRAKPKINGASGSVSNAVLRQELPATALFQGIDVPSGTTCTGQPAVGQAMGTNAITCTIAELTTTEIRVDFRVIIPDDNTDHKAYASVAATGNTDSNPSNDNLIARNITTYKRADLALAFTSPLANSSHEQGDVVPYKIVVSNTNNTYAFPLKVGERAALRFSQPTGTAFQGSPRACHQSKPLQLKVSAPVPSWCDDQKIRTA